MDILSPPRVFVDCVGMPKRTLSAPQDLLDWFFAHRRELPWRTSRGVARDPWWTLLSETMSQQTRLEVVVPRFRDWIVRFPSPQHLAQASEEEVLAAWAGLGYYSRARNLRQAARTISEQGWPDGWGGMEKLPGVGPYTAAAVASLCQGEQVPMIDGNAIRVLSRVHALGGDPRSGVGAKSLRSLAEDWIRGGDAGEVNEATMELGAVVCAPRSPRCGECPLVGICRAAELGEPERFPPRRERPGKVLVEREVLVVAWRGGILLRPAAKDELLKGLWIPPALGDHAGLESVGEPYGTVRHGITVHDVRWNVRQGRFRGRVLPDGWISCPLGELKSHVVSSLVRKTLEMAGVWGGDRFAKSP